MNTKQELKTFFTWLRNGTCFAVTWFLILELIASRMSGSDTISVANLTKTIIWTMGGVLLFCVAFTRLLIRKLGFTARLTLFTTTIVVYEILFFYNIGFFTNVSRLHQWVIFFVIVLCCYFICLAIYAGYRKKKSEIYTLALQKYQEERRIVNE